MTPHVDQYVSEEDKEIFFRIRDLIHQLPDIDLGKDERGEKILLSCHMLTRALSKIFKIPYRDGLYAKCYEHSWLQTKCGNIIDVYPVLALGGPVLVGVSNTILSPARTLYVPKSARSISQKFSANSFHRSVRRIVRGLNSIFLKGGLGCDRQRQMIG